MTKRPTVLCLAAVALFAAAAPAFAHGDEDHAKRRTYDASKVEDTAFGREGDPKKVVRTIRIEMTDTMRYTPAQVTIKRGQTVRFVLHNGGKLLHEMVLGTTEALKEHAELMKRFPEMEHTDPNMAHVKPGATGQIVWQFTQAGEFEFACLQPGHYETGMVGRVSVK
ncbi:MAG TPA: cupredoxin family protein [Burkholderiaceae bacterium]|nr:cupredoxin family protein [Burkholderiaceae bacterium]